MKPENDTEAFLTTKEACQMLKVNPVTLWRYTRDGKLSFFKIGSRKMYLKSQIIAESLIEKTA